MPYIMARSNFQNNASVPEKTISSSKEYSKFFPNIPSPDRLISQSKTTETRVSSAVEKFDLSTLVTRNRIPDELTNNGDKLVSNITLVSSVEMNMHYTSNSVDLKHNSIDSNGYFLNGNTSDFKRPLITKSSALLNLANVALSMETDMHYNLPNPVNNSASSDINSRNESSTPKHPAKNVLSSAKTSRGRPKQISIPHLIKAGVESSSKFKCTICHRAFKQNKNLRSHLTTHSERKPYDCGYPGCEKSFNQSGQLKIHFYLHTKEKPYKCSSCPTRFRHQNRKCNQHPGDSLSFVRECPLDVQRKVFADQNLSPEQKLYMEQHFIQFQSATAEEDESKRLIEEMYEDDDRAAYLLQNLNPLKK